MVTREIQLSEIITGITVGGSVELNLIDGTEQFIEVTADNNVIDRLIQDSRVRNGVYDFGINGCLKNTATITLNATIPNLSKVEASGSVDITTIGKYLNHGSSLELQASGACEYKLDLGALEYIKYDASGASKLDITGDSLTTFDIILSGDGKVKALDLKAKNVDIDMSGSGDVEVFGLG